MPVRSSDNLHTLRRVARIYGNYPIISLIGDGAKEVADPSTAYLPKGLTLVAHGIRGSLHVVENGKESLVGADDLGAFIKKYRWAAQLAEQGGILLLACMASASDNLNGNIIPPFAEQLSEALRCRVTGAHTVVDTTGGLVDTPVDLRGSEGATGWQVFTNGRRSMRGNTPVLPNLARSPGQHSLIEVPLSNPQFFATQALC